MTHVEPIPGEPAATADHPDGTALVVADYHAGIESWIRHERGLNVPDRAAERRDHLARLLDERAVDHLVVLGDLAHFYGKPHGAERGEIEAVLETAAERVPVTVVKGNHDGDVESAIPESLDHRIGVTDTAGVRIGDIGYVHGHTWPDPHVLDAEVVCIGHEHPQVRLEDEVGGSRTERVWLRGPLRADPFRDHDPDRAWDEDWTEPELVVFPAFNDLAGGTWVNVEGQEFLAPFLPDALESATVYLLNGTRLGELADLRTG